MYNIMDYHQTLCSHTYDNVTVSVCDTTLILNEYMLQYTVRMIIY